MASQLSQLGCVVEDLSNFRALVSDWLGGVENFDDDGVPTKAAMQAVMKAVVELRMSAQKAKVDCPSASLQLQFECESCGSGRSASGHRSW